MSDLRDQLKKAGLLSKKKAKKIELQDKQREHQRLKAAKVGDEATLAALETEQERRRRELEASEQAKKAAEAARVEAARLAREHEQHLRRIHDLIDANRIRPGHRETQWSFVASHGRVERMPVSDSVADSLQHGEYAIVERPLEGAPEDSFRFVIVPAATGRRLAEIDPVILRFLASLATGSPVIASDENSARGKIEPDTAVDEDEFTAGLE